jgi:hypothetical protein
MNFSEYILSDIHTKDVAYRRTMRWLAGGAAFLELYTEFVFLVSIGWYFLGIYRTNTAGKLGQYCTVL